MSNLNESKIIEIPETANEFEIGLESPSAYTGITKVILRTNTKNELKEVVNTRVIMSVSIVDNDDFDINELTKKELAFQFLEAYANDWVLKKVQQ